MPSAVSGGGHGGGGGGGGGGAGGNMNPQTNEECGIRDVWRHNLDEEFRTIRLIVQKYHFVAMDTEFPGVVARPVGEFRSSADYQYQSLRCNVDLLRIIQLGLTFMDDDGRTPSGFSTWQFNFKFNLSEDMYAQDSIDLLLNSGIQFKKHEEDGIDPLDFAELLMTSGIVLMDNIRWLSFHSGYDFAYLLKLLTDQNLPSNEGDFFELLRIYFPTIYDVKYLMKSCKNLKGGLQEVADQLELRRVGPQHQAGSDSLLTGMAFFKMREVHTNGCYATTTTCSNSSTSTSSTNNSSGSSNSSRSSSSNIVDASCDEGAKMGASPNRSCNSSGIGSFECTCAERYERCLRQSLNHIDTRLKRHRKPEERMFFEDNIDNAKYCGHLYGLGTPFVANGNNNTTTSGGGGGGGGGGGVGSGGGTGAGAGGNASGGGTAGNTGNSNTNTGGSNASNQNNSSSGNSNSNSNSTN
uniref:poly(A)-specific ribonuclease n=1 Tax=Anopheles dirus TaxID=7168 RepID=A0A182NPL4_9DIPT